jgi:hypothetical protein
MSAKIVVNQFDEQMAEVSDTHNGTIVDKVAIELENNGYPVFLKKAVAITYRGRNELARFDIVSDTFAIDIKLKSTIDRRHEVKETAKYLPDLYTLYKYYPNYTDEMISLLNSENDKTNETYELNEPKLAHENDGTASKINNILWVNSLNKIYFNEKRPVNKINIISHRQFIKFLAIQFDRLKFFDKINIKKSDFYTCYFELKYATNFKHYDQDITFCDKVEYLLETNKINFIEGDFDKSLPSFIARNHSCIYQTHETTQKMLFRKRYCVQHEHEKIISISVNDHIPLIAGITKKNDCGTVVFMSSKKCRKHCFKCNNTNDYLYQNVQCNIP